MTKNVVIIGGGPAGLMAAEVLTAQGITVDLYDAMPSLGRKFLMAGKSGLNLTHAEPFVEFLARFTMPKKALHPMLSSFTPDNIQQWAKGLGVETFVGTSNLVFPVDFKAAPLLRKWLKRLRASGMTVHARHYWTGWNASGELTFDTPSGTVQIASSTTILALGGASWPLLGSDAAWVPLLAKNGVSVAPLKASNCGFEIEWSDHLREKFEGTAVQNTRLHFDGKAANGAFMITKTGIEGGPVYALSAALRAAIEANGTANVTLDLLPDLSLEEVSRRLAAPRAKKTMSTHLKRTVKISGVKAALLRECTDADTFADSTRLAKALKALPLTLNRPSPITNAISTAGGVRWTDVDEGLQLNAMPNVFVAGEMLDWDAPTGGYLLSACFATGHWAGTWAGKK